VSILDHDETTAFLLCPRDRNLDRVLTEAVWGPKPSFSSHEASLTHCKLSVNEGRELDFALDFDNSCRGTTLLSAVHTCYERLPIVVTDFGGHRAGKLPRLRELAPEPALKNRSRLRGLPKRLRV
jgi:hypothetical protein